MMTSMCPGKSGEFEHLEELGEMQTLPHIHDIETGVKTPGAVTIQHRSQITRTVERRTVLFLQEKRWHVRGRQVNNQGPLALGHQAPRLQLLQGSLHVGLKKRLPEYMLKGDAQEIVHLLKFRQRDLDKPAPVLARLRITRFEPLEPPASLLGK